MHIEHSSLGSFSEYPSSFEEAAQMDEQPFSNLLQNLPANATTPLIILNGRVYGEMEFLHVASVSNYG